MKTPVFDLKKDEINTLFVPEPFTDEEWNLFKMEWDLVCRGSKRKNFTLKDAKYDYSWSHYVVGRLIETVKNGIKT
jgi:hypothetical protein